MPTSVRLRRLFVPASIGLILVVAVGWYDFLWLPSEHRYLDDRNFRVLKTLSVQIRASIDNFDKMLDNAADSGITNSTLEDYLSSVVPQLEKPKDEESKPIIGSDYSDPPRIAVAADEGTHFLYLAFQRKQVKYPVRTDLNKLIGKLLPPDNPFNILLVARHDGEVIFQKSTDDFQTSSAGIELARLDMLEDASGDTKTGKPDPIRVESLLRSSRYAEVKLAGAIYRLYAQPMQLSFLPADPREKGAKKNRLLASADQWVLCGLVRTDVFRSESQSIPYTYRLWLLAAVLLALASRPFLKLHLSSPSERLRAGEVVTAAVFACFAAAALTFILLDLYYWKNQFVRPTEEQMHQLARAIDRSFGDEKDRAFDQLHDFYTGNLHKQSELRTDLGRLLSDPNEKLHLIKGGGGCRPTWACRVNILSDDVSTEPLKSYPNLLYVSWSDSHGNQRIKWTTLKGVTPFLNLDDPSISYYSDVKRALSYSGGPNSVPTQGIGSQYSPNTGKNITIFWELVDADGNPISKKVHAKVAKNVFCAALVTRPISVINPVLPGGFQFAVIKPDGTVVFHSDQTRNLRENFFAETDQNQDVRSIVSIRADESLVAKYMGRRHRLYLHPMSANRNELWDVVVFRDLRVEETMNLGILSLASIMFSFYAGMIALVLVLAHWARRGKTSSGWLWPDSRKSETHWWLLILNSLIILLLFVLPQVVMAFVLLSCAVLIPLGALIFNFVTLRRAANRANLVDLGREPGSFRWQLSYAGTCTTLLVVVAVLPCVSFFKVAVDFENKRYVERNQLRLAADLDGRAELVRSQYQKINLGERYKAKILAGPEDQHARELVEHGEKTALIFSYHEILGTTIDFPPKNHPALAACSLSSADGQQRRVDSFLSSFGPSYNEIAAEDRYLAETDSSDVWSWSLISCRGQDELELTNRGPGNTVRTITSLWTPFQIPWGEWGWWVGTVAFLAALFGFVQWSLRRIFLLELDAPISLENLETKSHPSGLIAKLSMNLLVIGPGSSPTIAGLIKRKDVQAWDIQDVLNVAQHSAKTADGISFVSSATGDQVDEIIGDGRPLVLYNCESIFDNPRTNRQSLVALERVLSNLGNRLVITTTVDPALKLPEGENEPWRTLLQSFAHIDLNSSSAQTVDETLEQFESRISAEAYQRWLFPRRSRPQKLVLVHLAQERLVSPNSRGIVCELMRERVVERRWGLLTIRDSRFEEFVKCAVPPDTIKHWEERRVGTRSASLRTYLLVVGVGVAGFLIYTQGAAFNSWVTYATGLAASVPVFMRVVAMFRGKSGGEA